MGKEQTESEESRTGEHRDAEGEAFQVERALPRAGWIGELEQQPLCFSTFSPEKIAFTFLEKKAVSQTLDSSHWKVIFWSPRSGCHPFPNCLSSWCLAPSQTPQGMDAHYFVNHLITFWTRLFFRQLSLTADCHLCPHSFFHWCQFYPHEKVILLSQIKVLSCFNVLFRWPRRLSLLKITHPRFFMTSSHPSFGQANMKRPDAGHGILDGCWAEHRTAGHFPQ